MSESNIIKLSILPHVSNKDHLECPKCGATAELKCDCGVDYKYMSASQVAEKAVMENPEKSDRAIAEQVNVDHKTVASARAKVESRGENSPTEKRIGRDGKQYINRGRAIALPEGFKTLSDTIRAVIELQFKEGISYEKACKQIGLPINGYRLGRDIILLSQRGDLADRDMRTVKRALVLLDERGQVTLAASLAKPIAEKLWGKKSHRFRMNGGHMNKQREAFLSSISFLLATCVNAADIPVPYLTPQDREQVLKELKEAETSLYLLRTRINGATK